MSDFKDPDEEEPPTADLQPYGVQSQSSALAVWLLHFILCAQAVFHVSDNALAYFIRFFKTFFLVLGRFCKISAEISECLPSSIYQAKCEIKKPEFRKYVVCKKCHKIYFFQTVFRAIEWHVQVSYVPFVGFQHTHMNECKCHVILKTVELASGRTYLYPRLTYCYLGLKVSLQRLLLRPDFSSDCELWRSRQIDEGVLSDVYDGKVWSDFQSYGGQPFLSEPGNFALMLNMDFFQPYKHVQYSVGAIYMTILNPPRGIRQIM